MKKYLAVILCLPLMLAGCTPSTSPTPTPPLAPGYSNQADQVMGETLAAAHAFYGTIQCETKAMNWSQVFNTCTPDPNISTVLVLTPTEKTAFNDFGAALNVAQPVYLAYHAGTATQAAAQAAVNTVAQKQSAIQIPQVTK